MACSRFALRRLRPALAASAALTVLVLVGCAQQKQSGYYTPQRESTLTDAQHQAQRQGAQAPAQIQLGFGDEVQKQRQAQAQTNAEQAPAAEPAPEVIRPLREPKTFLGTLPCLTGPSCPAERVTLTLAPNGQWRARMQELGASPASTRLGCWDVIGTQPWRIVLRSQSAAVASFTFVNDNLLRVDEYNGARPTLVYHLTRQPDVDGIDELANAPAPQCEDRS